MAVYKTVYNANSESLITHRIGNGLGKFLLNVRPDGLGGIPAQLIKNLTVVGH